MINEIGKIIKPSHQICVALLIVLTLLANPLSGISATQQQTNSQRNNNSLSNDEKILHVLNRLGYGPRPGDLARIKQIGLEKYIEQQLQPSLVDDRAVAVRLKKLESLDMQPAELVRSYPPPKLFKDNKDKKNEFALNSGPNDEQGNQQDKRANRLRQRRENLQINEDEIKGQPRMILLELAQQHLLRAVYSEQQLNEVMVDFWFNHFNIFWAKGADRYLLTPYIQETIRPNALNNFPQLLAATAKSPAMLFYLDNWLSVDGKAVERIQAQRELQRQTRLERQQRQQQRQDRLGLGKEQNDTRNSTNRNRRRFGTDDRNDNRNNSSTSANTTANNEEPNQPNRQRNNRRLGLNENYARELMELHTLGVDGGYTQKDVTEVARCFTGWTIRRVNDSAEFNFNARMHDNGEKVVLGVKIPAGGGQQDGERVLEILAKHPSTARFIATKLVRRFVSDNPPAALVNKVAAIYTSTDGDIPTMLRTIFNSTEFYARDNYYGKVKSPLALVASALRAADAETNVSPQLVLMLAKMGQPLFLCQPPTGYGDTAEKWVNTAALVERLNFAVALCEGRIAGTTPKIVQSVSSVSTIDQLIKTVMLRDVGETTRRELQKEAGEMNSTRLPKLIGLMLGSPEFQKM